MKFQNTTSSKTYMSFFCIYERNKAGDEWMFQMPQKYWEIILIAIYFVEILLFMCFLKMAAKKSKQIITPIKNLTGDEDLNQTYNIISLIQIRLI